MPFVDNAVNAMELFLARDDDAKLKISFVRSVTTKCLIDNFLTTIFRTGTKNQTLSRLAVYLPELLREQTTVPELTVLFNFK